MKFTLRQETYRLRFQYQSCIVAREISISGKFVQVQSLHPRLPSAPYRAWHTLPGRQLMLTVTETHRKTICRIERLETVNADGTKGWIAQYRIVAECSLEDRYRRREGQAKALGHLLKALWHDDPDLAKAVVECWENRFSSSPDAGKPQGDR